MSEYITFKLQGSSASGKTEIWTVEATSSGAVLGEISWHARWRQYAFYPFPTTIYNPECMRFIADHCEMLTRELRDFRARSRSEVVSVDERHFVVKATEPDTATAHLTQKESESRPGLSVYGPLPGVPDSAVEPGDFT